MPACAGTGCRGRDCLPYGAVQASKYPGSGGCPVRAGRTLRTSWRPTFIPAGRPGHPGARRYPGARGGGALRGSPRMDIDRYPGARGGGALRGSPRMDIDRYPGARRGWLRPPTRPPATPQVSGRTRGVVSVFLPPDWAGGGGALRPGGGGLASGVWRLFCGLCRC